MGLLGIAKHECYLEPRKCPCLDQFNGCRPTNFVYEIGERKASGAETSLQGPDARVELCRRVGNGKAAMRKLCLQQLHQPVENVELP
jgi:hypothetical protein